MELEKNKLVKKVVEEEKIVLLLIDWMQIREKGAKENKSPFRSPRCWGMGG